MTAMKTLYDDEAREVILPGVDGEFSVMDFHQPCLYCLRPGRIKIIDYKKAKQAIPVRRGIAKVISNRLTVTAET